MPQAQGYASGVKRRTVLAFIGYVALWPALAQQVRQWRMGLIYVGSRRSAEETGRYAALVQGLRQFGYIEGKNLVIERRYADAKPELYEKHAAEMARMKLDVIVSTATPIHHALRRVNKSIPVVMTVSPDPVGEGLAASLARPGGNITGITSSNAELSSKYLELLSACVPGMRRVGVLFASSNSSHAEQLRNVRAAAQSSGLDVVPVDVAKGVGIAGAVATAVREKASAAVILADGFFVQHASVLAAAAREQRLATIYGTSEYPEAGGMMSYGPDIRDNYRRVAAFVHKIFNGAKAGDLPIEQPTLFELVINRKAAEAIGVRIPQELLLRAERVID